MLFPVSLACATANAPSYTTREGIEVYLNGQPGPSQAEVEATFDVVATALISTVGSPYTPESIAEAFHGLPLPYTLVIQPGPWFACIASPSGKCAGMFHPLYRTLEVAYEPCTANTALAHELLHLFNWLVEHRMDPGHDDQQMFSLNCKSNCDSIERITQHILCAEFCHNERSCQ